MTQTATLQQRFEAALMPNYGVPPVAIAVGRGCRVWDADGRPYLDLIGGIAVSALGHGHPAIISAVSSQVAKFAHTSNLFLHEPEVALAERLQGLLGRADARVFLANSGTEANEAAIKLVLRKQDAAGSGRNIIVAADHSFHGRSLGSLAITGKESIRAPFAPFGLSVRWVPYGDAAALSDAVRPDVAAVFLEPALGEGGVVPAPEGYLRAARSITAEAGAALVLDEIQSGIGRTGAWFACQAEGVMPDVITLAKGLGGGLPIGACIGVGEYGTAFRPGDHGSTFGGNPVACAAALAVIDAIEAEDILANVAKVGAWLKDGIAAISHPLLREVRGSGLWLGAVLTAPVAADVTTAARERGFLVNPVQPDVVRLAPPLILTEAEAADFLTALPGILDAVHAAGQASTKGA
ncbi:MAG TPA: acetylornithine transaminase [Trebonia sp.]|nr:acetylornithine transaminase [Trebonia sp.]